MLPASAVVESRIVENGVSRAFKLEVVPVNDPESKTRCLLVVFHSPEAPKPINSLPESGSADQTTEHEARLQELERELLATKQYLQSTIEELESANEELQSSNEELQSTNEELETSKEELQSSNEELSTVNDELHDRMAEPQTTNDDLHNVLTGIGNAVVIIGLDLRIRRYTDIAERLLNLVPSDIGRSVSQLNAFVVGQRVEDLAAEVIQRLVPIEKELMGADHRLYSLNVTPYRTLDHSIRGAVIVLIDIQDRRRATV